MKMIRPIVNIGKIIEPYEAVIVGFNGVLTDGNGIAADAVNALVEMKKRGTEAVSFVPLSLMECRKSGGRFRSSGR